MTDPTRVCGWCRGPFVPTRPWQRYCTPSCKNGARTRRALNKKRDEPDRPVTALWTGGPGGPARRKHPPARILTYEDYLREVEQ